MGRLRMSGNPTESGFNDVNPSAGQLNGAVLGCKNRMVFAHANVKTGEELFSALTQNNVAGNHSLTAGHLETQIFRVAVASVSC